MKTFLGLERPKRKISQDIRGLGTSDVKQWVLMIVLFIALFIIIAALYTNLASSLASYAANETVFGPIIEDIVPILLGVGLLLLAIAAFLGRATTGGSV